MSAPTQNWAWIGSYCDGSNFATDMQDFEYVTTNLPINICKTKLKTNSFSNKTKLHAWT